MFVVLCSLIWSLVKTGFIIFNICKKRKPEVTLRLDFFGIPICKLKKPPLVKTRVDLFIVIWNLREKYLGKWDEADGAVKEAAEKDPNFAETLINQVMVSGQICQLLFMRKINHQNTDGAHFCLL